VHACICACCSICRLFSFLFFLPSFHPSIHPSIHTIPRGKKKKEKKKEASLDLITLMRFHAVCFSRTAFCPFPSRAQSQARRPTFLSSLFPFVYSYGHSFLIMLVLAVFLYSRPEEERKRMDRGDLARLGFFPCFGSGLAGDLPRPGKTIHRLGPDKRAWAVWLFWD
jgi:hypothetical protein